MADLPLRLQPGDNVVDALNYTLDALDSENRTKIIKNQGIGNLLLGYQAGGFGSGDYGIKISKTNPATGLPYDVTTASNDQLLFSSAFDTFKVVLSGTSSLTVPHGATGTYGANNTIAHGLGYVPAVLGFVETVRDDQVIGTFWSPVPYSPQFVAGTEFSILADATNIYPLLIVSNAAGWADNTINYRYYILQETAT
jgi:hypothetical protein